MQPDTPPPVSPPPPERSLPGQAPRPPEGQGPQTLLDRVYEMARSTGMPRWAKGVIGILSALIFVIVAANVDLGKTLDDWFSIQAQAETAEQGREDKAIAIMGDLLQRQQKLTLAADEAQAGLALERGIEALGASLDRIAEALARDGPCLPRNAGIRGGAPSQEVDSGEVDSSTAPPRP